MKFLTILVLALSFLVAQTSSESSKKKDVYDPDNLGPGEVACGRPTSKKSPPCKCMKARQEMKMVENEKCKMKHLTDIDKVFECISKIEPCPMVKDAESFNTDDDGNSMPPQCKRTCKKARCECCKS